MVDRERMMLLLDEAMDSEMADRLVPAAESLQAEFDESTVGNISTTRLVRFVSMTTAAMIEDLRRGLLPGPSQHTFLLQLVELLEPGPGRTPESRA